VKAVDVGLLELLFWHGHSTSLRVAEFSVPASTTL
jgi:hypothetical protein